MFTVPRLLFLCFAFIALGSAVRMVVAHQVFHAAFWLILSFFGIAAIYVMLEAPFMTGLQLFLYIGGVAVLNIMAIMVTRQMMHPRRTANDPLTAALMAFSTFSFILWMILQLPFPNEPQVPAPVGNLPVIGELLVDVNGYALPFELVSLLLFVVLLSVLYLAKER